MPEGEGDLKAPRYQHLESLAEQGEQGAIDELANCPELPPLADYLWHYWRDLNETRSSNGMGLSRLTREEIAQWARDEGVALERWERRTILKIDAAFVSTMATGETPKKPGETDDDDEGEG